MGLIKTPGILTGHNLTSYINEISPQDCDDITHSTQIATKSADMSLSRFSNSTTWFHEYLRTLVYFGWSNSENAFSTKVYEVDSQNIPGILMKNAKGIHPQQANAMIDTLDALKSDKPAILSLDQESLLGERFQVIPARYGSKGIIEIAVFNLQLVVHTRKSNFLFWRWEDQEAKIIQRRVDLKLDRNELEIKRTQFEKKRREITMKRFDLRKK